MKSLAKYSYERKKSLIGFTFLIPFLIGCTTFFIRPVISTIIYSFLKFKNIGGVQTTSFVGFDNYAHAFLGDIYFMPRFTRAISDMLFQVPFILLFSLIVAVVLNQEFRGRLFFRAIFFLPVIIASGEVIKLMQGDTQIILSGSQSSMMFQAVSMEQILLKSGVDSHVVDTMIYFINNIFNLAWKSGVQILIFIAGLKTIPSSLYEVAHIEGANAWETFWLVTFKMLGPIISINVIYTITDSFNDYLNPMIKYISDTAKKLEIEYSSAMSWMYFLAVFIITAVVFLILSKVTFSYSERER